MKTKLHSGVVVISLIIVAALINTFSTCKATEEDPCEATKMIETKEPLIYLKLEIKQFTINLQYNSHAADVVAFVGDISKYYCPDDFSAIFSFDTYLYPKNYDPQYLEQGFYLDQPYQFKFENDKDYLKLTYTINFSFNEQMFAWSDTLRTYYQELIYDYNLNSYYIPIIISDYPLK